MQYSRVPGKGGNHLHSGNKLADYFLFEPGVEEYLLSLGVSVSASLGFLLKTTKMMPNHQSDLHRT